MGIRFTKMHGLGNDYTYVDCFSQSLDGIDRPALARAVSHRHRGVGSDGLILITPPTAGVAADVRMEMYNADGSRGEMCGNGIRCVAMYAVEHGLIRNTPAHAPGPAHAVTLRVQTDRGVLDVTAGLCDGRVKSVRVDMGAPILEPARIPVAVDGDRCIRRPIGIDGASFDMTCVSMGNPHLVVFVERAAAIELERIGPQLERHRLFPNRVNVHFAERLSRDEVLMRTWERGSGVTQACGTGACAVLVAGVLEERLGRRALVHLPGGDLDIEWAADGRVFKSGPAEEVFSGEWPA